MLRSNMPTPDAPTRLLVGGGETGTISIVEFDGSRFRIVSSYTIDGANVSWLLLRKLDHMLYAVDENTNAMHRLTVGPVPPPLYHGRDKKLTF